MASHSIMPFPDQVVDSGQLICEDTFVCVSIWMKLVSSLLWNSDQWGFACPGDTANVPLNNESQPLLDWESNYHCMNSTKQMKTGKWNSIITALRPESAVIATSNLVGNVHMVDVFSSTQKSLMKFIADWNTDDHVISESQSCSMGLMVSREWPDPLFHSALVLCWWHFFSATWQCHFLITWTMKETDY